MAKVTAIVSTYNSERWIRGRVDDLLHQTLYERGELEIVVVNSGSKQGEDHILRDYLGCITYIHSLREPIYASWNRAIALSTGDYLTNANADDRLYPDALAIVAACLDAAPDCGLIYGDAIVTDTVNATWHGGYHDSTKPPYNGAIRWPDFDPALLPTMYYGGPNPMWRRSLHDRFGLFDDSYQLAGDYEFALRLVAGGVRFLHIARPLTLFYDDGTGINNPEQSAMESRRAILRWRGFIK